MFNFLKFSVMYYVKQIRFDFETGKRVSQVLLSTKDKSIALGVCKQFADSANQYCKPPCDVSNRVFDGNTVIARFDCLMSSQAKSDGWTCSRH